MFFPETDPKIKELSQFTSSFYCLYVFDQNYCEKVAASNVIITLRIQDSTQFF